jgi:methyl-accepting chemotaxis protein/methyl-accepting chemotaxis protein-1 (serine sensor receptor)
MRAWSIGKKFGFANIAVAAAVLSIGMLTVWTINSLEAVIDDAFDRDVVKQALAGDLDADLREMLAKEEAAVSSVLQNDAAELEEESREYAVAKARVETTLATLKSDTETDAERAVLREIEAQYRAWQPLHEQMEQALKKGDTAAAVKLQDEQLDGILDKLDATVDKLSNEFTHTSTQSNAEGDLLVERSFMALAVLGAICLIAVAGNALIVRTTVKTLRGSVTELSDGAQQVASASSQVASASQGMSQGATEQAASLEETSASMEEMASMTRSNAENSHEAAGKMHETEQLVQNATVALDGMVTSMTAIKDSSDRVAKIIKTIDEIAFQTNILALNAAVEAARAGDAGMGFAVVADEVRSLAQRSAQAAKDTAALIDESISNSHEGHRKVQTVTEAIDAITESMSKARALVDGVSVASRQQAQGIDQVTQAIAQMEKVTQNNAAMAEESAAASEELNAQAEASMEVVGNLSALVVGRKGSGDEPMEMSRSQSKASKYPRAA